MKANDTNHLRVNWVDGMKINKDHFIAMEHAMLARIRRTEQRSVSPIDYGLLPCSSNDETALDVLISVDGSDSVEVVLKTCRAVTLGGYQIDLDPKTSRLLEASGHSGRQYFNLPEDGSEWYIALSVDPYDSVGVGDSDVVEEPPRRPHVLPRYRLNLLAHNEASDREFGRQYLTLGRVLRKEGRAIVDTDFIPPCSSVESHPELQRAYGQLALFFNQMEAFSMHIIQKIHQKKQTNGLAHTARYLSEQIVRYLNTTISEYRFIDSHKPPIAMITKAVNLARVIKSSLDIFIGTGKEDFLTYLTEWCHLSQGGFENVLVETIALEYRHSDIHASLVRINAFTALMLSLFKKISELDYIGKKADSGIFVKEEIVNSPESGGRRSILLD